MEGNEHDNYHRKEPNLITNGEELVQYIEDLHGQGIGAN